MNPRKAKDLIAEVSLETSVDEGCLKALTAFYWAAIRQELVSLRSNYVLIPHLGTFSVKNKKTLLKTIARYERLVAKPRISPPVTMGRYAMYKNNEEKLSKLYDMLKVMHEDDKRWEELYKFRKDAWEAKKNLGQPLQDNGGDNQFSVHQSGGREDLLSADENL